MSTSTDSGTCILPVLTVTGTGYQVPSIGTHSGTDTCIEPFTE